MTASERQSFPPLSYSLKPLHESERLLEIDALRGMALFGILVVNLQYFSMPTAQVDRPSTSEDVLCWGIVNALFTMKFVTIFSLLFGMGLVVQMKRALAASRSFTALWLRRLAALGVFGLVHGTLLFDGDILFVYAVLGLPLLLLRNRRPATLLKIAAALVAVGALLSLGESVSEQTLDERWTGRERQAYQEGPLPTTIAIRSANFVAYILYSTVTSFNWRVAALFLVGAALMKLRFFERDRRPLHRRLLFLGLFVGLPLEVAAVALRIVDDSPGARALATAVTEVSSLLLSFGYVALMVYFVNSGALAGFSRLLATVGRLALTNYLAQSVVANFVFCWYGLGLYDDLSRVQVLGLAVVIFSLQMFGSAVWLTYFRMGPMEWLWRRITYGGSV